MLKSVETLSVSLWGPPGSGKSWLYAALLARVRELSLEDSSLNLELLENGRGIPPVFPRHRSPTASLMEHALVLTRRPDQWKWSSPVNCHSHRLRLTDFPGQATLDILDAPERVAAAKVIFDETDLAIVILDPTRLRKTRPKKRRDVYPMQMVIEDYVRYLWVLLDHFSSNHKNRETWIAICITKVDRMPSPSDDPWEILQVKFGAQMMSVVREFQNRSGPKIRLFSVSAAGFLDEDFAQPNYSRGRIKDKTQWSPWRVEMPFFWVLDEVERARLAVNGSKWPRRIFFRKRKRRYLAYPGLNKNYA